MFLRESDRLVWGYERSVNRYLSTRVELGEPDPFRMKYRSALTEVIRNVVLQIREDQSEVVQAWAAERIPGPDLQRFINQVQVELKGLHAGNIALLGKLCRIPPSHERLPLYSAAPAPRRPHQHGAGGVIDEIAGEAMNHKKSGIVGVHNKYRYDKGKEVTLTKWEQLLLEILETNS